MQDADALTERLTARRDELAEQLARLDDEGRTTRRGARGARRVVGARARAARRSPKRAQEEAREARTTRAGRRSAGQARVQVANDRERRLAQEQQSAAARLESLRAELTDLSQADSALAEQMAAWQLDLETREATLADGEARLGERRSRRARGGRGARRTPSTRSTTRVASRRRQSDELHHAELRHTELGGRRAAIRERLETEWRRPLDDMLAEAQPVELDDDALRAEAESLRQELERLGPVNVLAIEEHEETVKRQDFLTGQRADLAEAKQSLQQAIREIDGTARELFLATFAQVRENFRQIFMSLFGGGECDLRLENPDAPLDCDIEIHASPRGKRTQRIHLLSSGERALVALSLLFGIFLTKPSPFCLLDEVDAPLDDANVGRFVRMLTQFKIAHAVHRHHAQSAHDDGGGRRGVRRDDAGARRVVARERAHARRAVGGRSAGGVGRRQRGSHGGMSRGRRAAALLGVVALGRVGSVARRAVDLAAASSGLKADSMPPAPNMSLCGARARDPSVPYTMHARAVDGDRVRATVLHRVVGRPERDVPTRLAAAGAHARSSFARG